MTNIRINWTVNLIQQVRVIHALAEAANTVVLDSQEIEKFDLLSKQLGLRLSGSGADAVDITRFLGFSHANPTTRIGGVERSLIFPHAITQRCRGFWPETRGQRVSFLGLVTEKRQEVLANWIHLNLKGHTYRPPDNKSTLARFKKWVFTQFGISADSRIQIGDLLLWSSDRGRRFPIKAWDEQYYRVLADAEFVLCPSGDFVWSYRFFESILCGAIPIVEEECPAYSGFQFHSFHDDFSKLKWTKEIALQNYNYCLSRITIPTAELKGELERIVEQSGRAESER